jgi:hypothetical protein
MEARGFTSGHGSADKVTAEQPSGSTGTAVTGLASPSRPGDTPWPQFFLHQTDMVPGFDLIVGTLGMTALRKQNM